MCDLIPPEAWQQEAVHKFLLDSERNPVTGDQAADLAARFTALTVGPEPDGRDHRWVREWVLLTPGSPAEKAVHLRRLLDTVSRMLDPDRDRPIEWMPADVEAAFKAAAGSVLNLAWLQPGNTLELAKRHLKDVALDPNQPGVVRGRLSLAGALRWLSAVAGVKGAVLVAVGVLSVYISYVDQQWSNE